MAKRGKKELFLVFLLMLCSIVFAALPVIDSLTLNDPVTYQNITATASTSDADLDDVKVIYDWQVNGSSIAKVIMPFEGGSVDGNSSGFPNATRDYSSYLNNGTAFNGTSWQSTGGHDGKGAYEFDGNRSYIRIGTGAWNNFTDMTIAFWAKPRSMKDNTEVMGSYDGVTFDSLYSIFHDADGTVFAALEGHGNGSTSLLYASPGTFQKDNWTHLVLVRDYTTHELRFFVDGIETNTTIDYTGGEMFPDKDLFIGTYGTTFFRTFNGTIDDFYIYDRALSAEQISLLYQESYNVIVSNETIDYDVWKAVAVPNDGNSDGNEAEANVTVLPDTVVPGITSTTPGNNSAIGSGTTEYNIQVTTNETAECKFNTTDVAWGNMTGLNSTNSTSHSLYVFNLADGGSYDYYFLCEDSDGNRMTSSYRLHFSVSNPPSSGGGSKPDFIYECHDDIDNDGDGLIDYPDDPGCASRYDIDEYDEEVEEENEEAVEGYSEEETEEIEVVEQTPAIFEKTLKSRSIDFTFLVDKGDELVFEYAGVEHRIVIENVGKDFVEIVIYSDPIKAKLFKNVPVEVDVDNDGSADISLEFQEMKGGDVEVKVVPVGNKFSSRTVVKISPKDKPRFTRFIPTIFALLGFLYLKFNSKKYISYKKLKFIRFSLNTTFGLVILTFLVLLLERSALWDIISRSYFISNFLDVFTLIMIFFALLIEVVCFSIIMFSRMKNKKAYFD